MAYFLIDLLAMGTIVTLMTIGLNLQYGYAGILNFTFYTFVGTGAYIAAVTTMGTQSSFGTQSYILHWSLPWPLGLLAGGVAAAVLGLLVIGVTIRKLRSDYLAIVTVSIGYVLWSFVDNYVPLFNGDNGLVGIPYITGGATLSNVQYSLEMSALGLVLVAGAVWLSRRIYLSPYGRVLRAIREDEVVAETFAKKVRGARVSIFVTGCFLGGLAGGLLAFYSTAWNPAAFLPLESFVVMSALIIGGTGNVWGALTGAFVVIELLAEISRYLPTFGNAATVGAFRAMLIGVALIVFLRFRPEGIVPEHPQQWYRSVPFRLKEAIAWPNRRRQPLA
jgi:branched-chain amino acid transport system permease protein